MSAVQIATAIAVRRLAALYGTDAIDVSAPCFRVLPPRPSGIWDAACDSFGDRPLPLPLPRFFCVSSGLTHCDYVEIQDNEIVVFSGTYLEDVEGVGARAIVRAPIDRPLRKFDDRDGGNFYLFHHLTTVVIHLYYLRRLAISSAVARITTDATRAEAEKRLRKGKKLPYFSYSVVRPNEYRLRDSVGASRPHGSPRQHQRIAHFRTLRSGKQIPVRDCVVGKAERGIVLQDYML